MNNGMNNFGNGNNFNDGNTRDLNKIIEGVMGTGSSSSTETMGQVRTDGGFGMQYQGPRSAEPAPEAPAVTPSQPEVVSQPEQATVMSTPEVQPQAQTVIPSQPEVASQPEQGVMTSTPEVQPQTPVEPSQNTMNPFLSKMDNSPADPSVYGASQANVPGVAAPTMNNNQGLAGGFNTLSNPSPSASNEQYVTSDVGSNPTMDSSNNLYNAPDTNQYSNTYNNDFAQNNSQNFMSDQANIGVQNSQSDPYGNLAMNNVMPNESVGTQGFGQSQQNMSGLYQNTDFNSMNNSNNSQNFNNSFLNNNSIDMGQNIIQEPNSLNSFAEQPSSQSGEGLTPKKKFPLSLREIILIAIAIAGVITVIVMYS